MVGEVHPWGGRSTHDEEEQEKEKDLVIHAWATT